MRANHILVTIDYETWQPLPAGKKIDWERDLIINSDKIMDIFERLGIKLTFMVEVCEYIWLKKNDPLVAKRIKEHIQSIISRGHDVQLHIHPNWMPETGASVTNGEWYWDSTIASCNDYPLDLNELISVCKYELEQIVQEVKPNYRVTAFRAGGYRCQPFDRMYDALTANGIFIDSSVYKGGISPERGYDFSKCRYANAPYKASCHDPQNKDDDSGVIELPITVYRNNCRLFMDNYESELIGQRFLNLGHTYFENDNNYYCIIGHSKAEINTSELEKQLKIISGYPNTMFDTLTGVADDLLKKHTLKAENSIEEVQDIMTHLYTMIIPNDSGSISPASTLDSCTALCEGYANTLGHILSQYGYDVKRITMYAHDMPRGRGERMIDTHEVVSLRLNNREYVLDPTVNRIIPWGIKSLIKHPDLATENKGTDSRYLERNYADYCTAFFYSRVIQYYIYPLQKYYIIGEGWFCYLYNLVYRSYRWVLCHIKRTI